MGQQGCVSQEDRSPSQPCEGKAPSCLCRSPGHLHFSARASSVITVMDAICTVSPVIQ